MTDKKQDHALQKILSNIYNYSDILLEHRAIIAAWNDGDVSGVPADDIKTPLYAALYVDLNKLDKEMRENVETIQQLFLNHWLTTTEWSPSNFWDELGAVFESMQERNRTVSKAIVQKLTPWVTDNREALEHAFFVSPGYSKLRQQAGGLNTDFSMIAQDFSWNTNRQIKRIEWSESFLRELYSGEDLRHMQVAWAEFRLMPTHLQIEFTIDALQKQAYNQRAVNKQWLDAKTHDVVIKLQLATVAAVYGYKEAYSIVENTQPSIIKQIQLGKDLGLTEEEILGTLLVSPVESSSLPEGLDNLSV